MNSESTHLQSSLDNSHSMGPNEVHYINNVGAKIKQILGRSALILGVVTGPTLAITTSEAVLAPGIAEAATNFENDYPDMDAADCSATYGQYSWCKPGGPLPYRSNRSYDYRNCTDGAMYWAEKYTGIDLPGNWGHAKDWKNNAATTYAIKNGDHNSIEPGDIAQDETGTYGHVGFVTAVGKDSNGVVTSITVAELNKSAKGNYSLDTYTERNSSKKFTRNLGGGDWDYFIDVNGINKGLNNEDLSAAAPAPITYDNLFVRQSGNLYGKSAIANEWGDPLTNGAADVKAAGNRIAIKDGAGNILAKDGLNGTWHLETGPSNEYIITPSMLVVRQAGKVLAKAALTDPWTTITDAGAVDVEAAGNRIAYKDSGGTIWAQDGVSSQEIAMTTGDQFTVTSSLFLVRQGGNVYGKTALANAWGEALTTGAADVQASGNRIAIKDGAGNIFAKEGLNGSWHAMAGPSDEYAFTPELFIVRQGYELKGKKLLGDGWATLSSDVLTVRAGGKRIAIIDSSGNIHAKDGVYGSWYPEAGLSNQVVVADTE